jgi:hypothetical protein
LPDTERADPGEPSEASIEPAFPIDLKTPEDEPVVWGITKPRLKGTHYKLIKTLVDAHPDSLTGEVLGARSGIADPIKMLGRIRSDPDWADALRMAGEAHGGYGINLKRPSKTPVRKPRK